MHENEVDLDIVRTLSENDWEEMGLRKHDIQRLIAATKTLPPGSFRVWGLGQNPVAAAVKKAMQEKGPPPNDSERAKPADTPIARFGGPKPEKKDKPKEADKPNKPRKHCELLDDLADASITKPTTDFGARQKAAKDIMAQAQLKVSQGKHDDAAELYGKAENLFSTFNDIVAQQDAANLKQKAIYQAQMDAKARDAKRKAAKISINQGLRAMQDDDAESALNHFSSAEQTLAGMSSADTELKDAIREHKEEASAKLARNVQLRQAALQLATTEHTDDSQDTQLQLVRDKEAACRALQVETEARKHELLARRIHASAATLASDARDASSAASAAAAAAAVAAGSSTAERVRELEEMKLRRRLETQKKVRQQQQTKQRHLSTSTSRPGTLVA